MEKPANLPEAISYFADLDVATEYVAALRWPDGWVCPHCGGRDYSYVSTRRLWKCKSCKKQSSIKVGTIFEDSALGLDKWLPAIWLAANPDSGVSSYELARALGTTQKSAWFMLHRIGEAEGTWTAPPPADVEPPVEVEESPDLSHLGSADLVPAPTDRRVLVALAVGLFALGAVVGWIAGRVDRRTRLR